MNSNLLSLAMLTAMVAFTLTGQSSSPPDRIAFTYVAVVDIGSGQVSRNQTVVIEGERIVSVGRSGSVRVPPGSQIVKASGSYLMPGLWDAHVHLSYLGACALPVFGANGITSVRDAGARLEDVAIGENRLPKVSS